MLKGFVRMIGGDPNKREIEKKSEIINQINSLESQFEALSNQALAEKTIEFRSRLSQSETLDAILAEAFAVVREASKRTIGLRHFDVQLIGGVILHEGKIAEMRTGEGKTLVATLPLYLNSLTGKGTHLVTVNDYLARRDARWMAPIYNYLGLSVGVLQMASRTENGKKAFIVDLERESPHEDQHQLRMVPRRLAYECDIIYGTNSEFGFDYLRDNMSMSLEDRVQRGHHFAIIDEVDNVLIDEARTPLIISGAAQDEAEWYIRMAQVVRALRSEDYEASEKDRTVTLSEIGEAHVEELLDMQLRDPDRPEDVTLEQARILGNLEQALRAQFLFKRNKDYLVQAGKVVIVDEFTGRLMPGRRWSDGLHQAVEAKEGVRVQSESVTYATITIQNYFRMYEKLAGMTGTAVTEAEEFHKIYKLEVLAIPTNLEYLAISPESSLIQLEDRDDKGYKYTFYAQAEDPGRIPVFWKRKDYPDIIYRTEEAKLRALSWEIMQKHVQGRPILVGTTSVELSERVSVRLRAEPIRRLAQINILRDAWIQANNHIEDGRLIEDLRFLNQPVENLDINAMRKLSRELEISFNPEEANNLPRLLRLLELSESHSDRVATALQGGIHHEVLNARKHTEESQIIAGAGAFGAVTIATNMAGRGVDIKLGGELAEEILSSVNRLLSRAGYEDPYNMSMDERQRALESLSEDDFGIYGSEVTFFLKHMREMELVRQLGGLHVIGSERHDARRIDNQLRGRSARQGDPGSSRFYLSMEDELMRLFGGQQADVMMQRLKIDDALPLEMGMVSRLVEQAQTRVEGANFDVRKHLLEYDDVLNTQRASIYAQRNRIFTKEDLTGDVTEMLQKEVINRIPDALADEESPWKLIAWLDQIQPPLSFGGMVYPSFTFRIFLEKFQKILPSDVTVPDIKRVLLEIAAQSLEFEKLHILSVIESMCAQAELRLENQISERIEIMETYFEGLSLEDETETRRPTDILSDLSSSLQVPVKIASSEQRLLIEAPDEVEHIVREQVISSLKHQSVIRLLGGVERRLESSLELIPDQLSSKDWGELQMMINSAAEKIFDARRERYLGQGGQIVKELDTAFSRINGPITDQILLQLLMHLPQGARATFDKKTHRRVFERTTRLNFAFYATSLLQDRDPEELSDEVLDHLEKAQEAIAKAWGLVELNRLSALSLKDLETSTRDRIISALNGKMEIVSHNTPLGKLPIEEQSVIITELGRSALTGVYRQLLLGVITELWVDYLTQMESLRVSIGLEAYAQRDPLVQYKNQAYELFQDLLTRMRLSVVTRMFTYQPRDISAVQTGISQTDSIENTNALISEVEESDQDVIIETGQSIQTEAATKTRGKSEPKKRRRRRRR